MFGPDRKTKQVLEWVIHELGGHVDWHTGDIFADETKLEHMELQLHNEMADLMRMVQQLSDALGVKLEHTPNGKYHWIKQIKNTQGGS